MRRRTVLGVLLMAGAVWAHGAGGVHLQGVIKEAGPKQLLVETTPGKVETVALTAATKLERDGKPIKLDEVKVGLRVVVHAKKVGAGLQAELVKLAPAEAGKAPAPGGQDEGHGDPHHVGAESK